MGNKIGNVPDVWTGCSYCSGKIIKHGFTKGNKQKYKAYEDIENAHNWFYIAIL